MNNTYEEKMNDYLSSIRNLMYTFEITKCCGYSTFVTIYKDESLADLYKKVAYHFSSEVVELYFLLPNNVHYRVPLSNVPVVKFVRDNIICSPVLLVPIYPLPCPIVYRLYLNDGHHCTNGHNNDSHCLNIGNNCNN
jgi:hypothetical protein